VRKSKEFYIARTASVRELYLLGVGVHQIKKYLNVPNGTSVKNMVKDLEYGSDFDLDAVCLYILHRGDVVELYCNEHKSIAFIANKYSVKGAVIKQVLKTVGVVIDNRRRMSELEEKTLCAVKLLGWTPFGGMWLMGANKINWIIHEHEERVSRKRVGKIEQKKIEQPIRPELSKIKDAAHQNVGVFLNARECQRLYLINLDYSKI